VLQEQRRERGLEQCCEHVPVADEPLELLVRKRRAALGEPGREIELARDRGAALPGDDVRADLREPPLRQIRVPEVELARDGEFEDAVAQKLESLVGGCAVVGPGGVGENVFEPLLGQRVDQAPERLGPLLVVTGAT
jgi:hypothetical protein